MDYWDIDLDDAIKSIDPETALNECTDSRSLCELIHRNYDGTIDYVEGNLQNLSNFHEALAAPLIMEDD